MEFALLGPIEVSQGGRRLPLGGPKQRALLADLLIHANEVVSVDRLIDDLWGDSPPETAGNALQTYVAQLRKVLEPERQQGAGGRVLQTLAPGYVLKLRRDQLDVARFEELLRRARELKSNPSEAATMLREALSLWRGAALADVADAAFAQAEAARLEDLRVVALENRIEAELALGRHSDLVGELEILVRQHPLRERMCGLLMLCLYRSGRQAEASQVYQRTRERLVEELGMEPGPDLQQLLEQILNQDPAIAAPAPSQAPRSERTNLPLELSTQPGGVALGVDVPLVARDAELERLLSVLHSVSAGHGRLVVLAGEPGVGKTRLAREVLMHAQTNGSQVFKGSCFEQHSNVPYLPFATALSNAQLEVQSGAPVRWPELALIAPELGAALAAEHQPEPDGMYTQLRVFQAATGLLLALAASQPMVLFLDDLHWADTTSLGLVLHLARHIQDARILILGTYRDLELGRHHPLEAMLREAIRERVMDAVHLRPLQLVGTAALLRARAGVSTVSDELVALVHGRAQGNPFFTEELFGAFVEQGAVSITDGRLQLEPQAELDLPQSIRSVVGERVGRLPVEVQNLLRLASVIGAEFDLDVLRASSGQSEETLLDALDACLEARVLEELHVGKAASPRPERYSFSHALIHQTLYYQIPAHRRRRLHLRVSEAMEGLQSVPARLAADLARHFLLGGDAMQAARYAVQAGDEASARYAHAEALHHYLVAVEVLRDEPGEASLAAEVQSRLARELIDLNRLEDAQSAFEVALASFQRLGDRAGQAQVHWGMGRLLHARYHMADALAHFDDALRLWPSEGRESDLVRLLSDAARAAAHHGSPAAATALSERAQALAERLGDPALLASALSIRNFDDPRLALFKEALDRAETLARSVDDWRTLTRVYMNRATILSFAGDLEANAADRRRAIETAERAGETDRIAFGHQSLARAYLVVGAWEEGRSAARTGLALDPGERLKGVPGRAILSWMDGRFEVALEQLQMFTDGARQRHDAQGVTIGLELTASLAMQLDRPAVAEAAAREAVEVSRNGLPIGLARALGPLAETLVILGAADAERNLVEALEFVDKFGLHAASPALLRARGVLLTRQSNHEAALQSLEASAAVARSQHARIELGRTLAVVAELARQQCDSALAEKTDAERASLVAYIGPEVRGLNWARDVPRVDRGPFAEARAAVAEPAGPLSRREREVAALLIGGLSNRHIADALLISERTAENHVGSILAKLGLTSRAQVAVWAVQQGLEQVPTRSWH